MWVLVAVEVNVHQGSNSNWSWLPWVSNQNFVPVNLIDGYIFNSNGRRVPPHFVAAGGRPNWSLETSGVVNMSTQMRNANNTTTIMNYWQYSNIQTHEFLHVFGVGDAYACACRGLDYALVFTPDQIRYEIMARGPWREDMYTSHYTIQMMILALLTGEWQSFDDYDHTTWGAQTQSLGAMDYITEKKTVRIMHSVHIQCLRYSQD